MVQWHDDNELFDLMKKELFTAVVGDILDKLGFLHQFLPPYLSPLQDDMLIAGRAMPVLEADFFATQGEENSKLSNQPFGLMFDALDDLKPNEVYVATGASSRFALWGELMSVRAMKLGAAGAVLDGYSRDTRGILKLGFPTISRGRFAQDQGARGKVVDYRVTVEIDTIRVAPGSIIFGDLDGVLVIPKEAEEEVIRQALEKVRQENLVRKALEEGMAAAAAFKQFGVM